MSGVYNPHARVLWTTAGSGVSSDITETGNSGTRLIDVSGATDVVLTVTATVAGDDTTLTVAVEMQDALGNWYPLLTTDELSDTTPAAVSAGLHTDGTVILPKARITWTLDGDNPYTGVGIVLTGR